MLFSPAKTAGEHDSLQLGRGDRGPAAQMVRGQKLGDVHGDPVLGLEKYGLLYGDLPEKRAFRHQRQLYEASSWTRANTWQRFRYITWPQLQPAHIFVTIILTINCFKVYDIVYM